MKLSNDIRTSVRQVVRPEFPVKNGDKVTPCYGCMKLVASEGQDTKVNSCLKNNATREIGDMNGYNEHGEIIERRQYLYSVTIETCHECVKPSINVYAVNPDVIIAEPIDHTDYIIEKLVQSGFNVQTSIEPISLYIVREEYLAARQQYPFHIRVESESKYIRLMTNACRNDVYAAIDSAVRMLHETRLEFIAKGYRVAPVHEVDKHPNHSEHNPELEYEHIEPDDGYTIWNQHMEMMKNDD
jgi:ribosome-associated translation inhibitor RaiA